MTARVFWAHGEFCATHPWEVIVATLTLTACMLTVEQQHHAPLPKPPIIHCIGCLNEAENNAADVILMTIIRCLAVLYSYYQFCNLQKLGCKYILGIAGLFTVCSSFVFTSTVLNFLRIDVSDLKDALFFFLLVIDLSKAAILAEFALSASNQDEVKMNIARGMSLLGPTITLDTIVETLVIGVGTLSGVHRLEMLSCFACLSVVVNYVVFMTFYPACLSLILELSRIANIYGNRDIPSSLISRALKEDLQKSNPVVQRVKLIMSAGLMLVHAHRCLSAIVSKIISLVARKTSMNETFAGFVVLLLYIISCAVYDSVVTLYSWWPLRDGEDNIAPLTEQRMPLNRTDDTALHGYIMRWITLRLDHIGILILLAALAVKFIFFENKENLEQRVRMAGRGYTGQQLPGVRSFLKTHEVDEGFVDKEVQTDDIAAQPVIEPISATPKVAEACVAQNGDHGDIPPRPTRSLDECREIFHRNCNARDLTDEEVMLLVRNNVIQAYMLEKAIHDPVRGVGIRRKIIGAKGDITQAISDLPYKNYDYQKVMGACCENVIGYMPVPVGVAGPLRLDEQEFYVPMATTEGCLVASTNRGCRALSESGGVTSRVISDAMTRAPVVRFPNVVRASEAIKWLQSPHNFECLKKRFDSSSRFARLNNIHSRMFGRLVYIRFAATTGDAMGMNMISKGTEETLQMMKGEFPEMEILSLSGNFCMDKKPSAVNWIEGRGKYAISEAIVPKRVVEKVLKTSVDKMIETNIAKNLIGSAAAGSIGGFNAHAGNIITAIYIATGQDPAQNVGSSNCMTLMEKGGPTMEDLYISCTMPSIEVGTVGGGTVLSPQAACLDMLHVKGCNADIPGAHANQLARIVCGTVLAGELSLMAALTAGHLVKSHLRHNRSATSVSQESIDKTECVPDRT